jgi:tetratricopeptide (TPR) repeat protein
MSCRRASLDVAAVLAVVQLVAWSAALSAQREPVAFSTHIAPIVREHCVGCHHAGGPAPFGFLTYEDVRRRARQIADVTSARYMPPWKPGGERGVFVGDRRLTDREIALIGEWASAGAPEGSRTGPLDPARRSGWQLGVPDVVVTLPEYTLPPEGLDVFRNFVVSVPGRGTRYVRGLEFRASSVAVHHANIRIDRTPASRRLDDQDPAPGYEGLVLRSADYPDGHFLGWTPGQFAPLAPPGLAWTLEPQSDFVVQLHMRPSGKPERIQPLIGLFLTDDPPRQVPAIVRLGRQDIDIPAGQSDYRSADTYTLPVDAEVHALQPHSHSRARSVRAWATLPDTTTRLLIDIPSWDFGWQDAYRFAQPFWLPAGTVLRTEFVFDNSAGNPRNPESPPKRALWGPRSSDEMGDVWVQVLTRTGSDRDRLAADIRRKQVGEDVVGYESEVRRTPDDAALRDDLGVLYLELGRPDDAARHFRAALSLRPASAVAHYNLGIALEAGGRFADAGAEFRESIRLDPDYAPARVDLGNVLLVEGRIAEATTQYREGVRLRPDDADARNNLGRALLAAGRAAEAAPELEAAVKLRPSHAAAHYNLAEASRELGDPNRAASLLRESTRLAPAWSPPILALSWLLSSHPNQEIRRPEEAMALATRAVELTGGADAAALDALAAAYARLGQFEQAIATGARALELARTARSSTVAAEDIEQRLTLYGARRPYTAER